MNATSILIWGVILIASIPGVRALWSVLYGLVRDRDARNYSSVFAEGPKETLLGTSAPIAGEDTPDAYGAGLIYKNASRGRKAALIRQTKVTDDSLSR